MIPPRCRSGSRMRSAYGVALLVAVASALSIGPLAAQQEAPDPVEAAEGWLIGRVVRAGQPVPGAPVALHRVTQLEAGEVATSVTGEDGRFTLPLDPQVDSEFNIFFVTAEYLSARYFGDPIHPEDPSADYTIEVFDTTSAPAEPARIVSRDIVLLPEEQGSWEVNEIVSISNPGQQAIVAPEGMPTWQLSIPEQAAQFQVGEGDILPHEVTLMENRVLLLTPVVPGQRDLWIRYRLPVSPSRTAFNIDQPTEAFNLFVEQPSHLTSVEGLASTRMVEADGEQYLQYAGASFQPGAQILLEWSNEGASPIDPVVAAVVVTVLLLVFGAWGASRSRAIGRA
jgi:5-hydroxyisourate hydrolase-like protein (transthyretin family)